MTEYKIDINEEGLALPDYNQEKNTRIEFLTTVGQFLSQAAPITEAMPGALPYLVQMVRWVAAGLRGSNEIQGVLDQAINALNNAPPAQPPAGPPPDTTRIQVETIKQQGETQRIPMKLQADTSLAKTKADAELRNKMIELNAKATQEAKTQASQQAHEVGLNSQDASHDQAASAQEAQYEERSTAQQAENQAAQANADAMVQVQRDNHEFAKAAHLQEKDHQSASDLAAANNNGDQ